LAAIKTRVADGSFARRYALLCPDGNRPYGTDVGTFYDALTSDVPDIGLPLEAHDVPATLAILDAIEFCHRVVSEPVSRDSHDYYRHDHLRFDDSEGKAKFREEINRVFARNGLSYELEADGRVVRLGPEPLAESLREALFETGDEDLDALLESARAKYLDPDLETRKEALEKLWDAWERLKTLESGGDKATSVAALLDRAANGQSEVREMLEREARAITEIGNDFRIRHHEIGKIPLEREADVDHLFHRCFALIRILLVSTDRGG
jgi:hypothetical protein